MADGSGRERAQEVKSGCSIKGWNGNDGNATGASGQEDEKKGRRGRAEFAETMQQASNGQLDYETCRDGGDPGKDGRGLAAL
ncbi:hypothetical protein UVI_02034070 [Ustilaginoidea virens]|uniref:Uncharacterized protein n=1 Tax=Ustilaginoidea virens TaxID=1159556 RepID=A0A1B5KTQ3_USTVR|nr:hypothetical protein UVI_02034070 [Ustilaginoidea virens]